MRIPTYLVRSKSGIFHFRFMIPLALRLRLGRIVFKRSLNTRDPFQAQILALSLAARYALVLSRLSTGAEMSKDILEAALAALESGKSRPWEAELPNGIKIRTTNDSEADNAAALRALEIATKTVIPAQASAPSMPFKRLDEAAKEFLASILVNDPKAKTLSQKKLSVNGFTKWKGANTNIALLVPKDFSDFAVYLKSVEKLASPTIANRVLYIGQMMEWAKQMRYYPHSDNPTKGIATYSKKQKIERAVKNGWQAFSDDQIKLLFDPENIKNLCPKSLSTRWCLVMSLYTGARISELAQLALDDFSDKSGAGWWLKIDSRESGQSVKTDSSRREIPVHPDLIKLGLIDRVKSLKKSGEIMLFPDLKPSQNGYGGAPSKGITRYLGALKINARGDGKIGAHSFRNLIIQHFDACGVSDSASRIFTGHALDLDAHEINYKTESKVARTNLTDLLGFLPKNEWGIDIKKLKPHFEEKLSG